MTDTVRVRLFDKSGVLIADVDPDLYSVAWRLNNVGQARFLMPYTDAKCLPNNLESGNRLLIEFENGLPDFAGVIDFPRRRTDVGVEITGYTAEKIFDWRVTAKSLYFDSTIPGLIYKGLIDAENGERDMGISTGSIAEGGTERTTEYHYHDLLRRIQDLANLTGQDFDVTGNLSGGTLALLANWYLSKGSDKSSEVYLLEDENVTQVILDEQGPVASRILLAGAGQTWGSERITSEETSATSETNYGYREWGEIQAGVVNQSTLDANAEELLAIYDAPRLKFSLTVLDISPALFADYDVGDVVTLQAFLKHSDWTYDGTVRVMAREWYPDDTCRLEVEEWAS